MTARRLGNLIHGLPPAARSVQVDPARPWTETEGLLANVFDGVMAHAAMFYGANTKKGTRPLKVAPYPRPKDPNRPPRRHATVTDLRTLHRRMHGGG